jgi:hypothetical protein
MDVSSAQRSPLAAQTAAPTAIKIDQAANRTDTEGGESTAKAKDLALTNQCETAMLRDVDSAALWGGDEAQREEEGNNKRSVKTGFSGPNRKS